MDLIPRSAPHQNSSQKQTMKIFFELTTLLIIITLIKCSRNSTTKQIDEDYYSNYDYELPLTNLNNGSGSESSSNDNGNSRISLRPESLILPVPENPDSRYTIDILPEVDLPDDSLADSDLRDHDFMDNLMYIYYGTHNKAGTNYGSEIIIIGSVLSCAAQLLTIFIVLLRKNLHGNKKDINCTFLQFMISLCFSNLLFMLGIYSTKNEFKCQIIGLTLHYMHLLTAFWIFTFSYYIYKRNCHNTPVPRTKILYTLTYCIPLVVTLVSFALLPKSFETKKFCFISVERGMIVNYMLPVFLLIMLTTAYTLTGVGNINIELSKLEFTSSAESLNVIKAEMDLERRLPDCMDGEIIILKESKTCLISLCLLQSIYNIVWFIAVVALENDDKSNNMAIAYSITSCLMNWYIFARSKSFLPNIPNNHMQLEENSMNSEKLMATNPVMVSRRGSSDDIPLLITSETEMREISRSDLISTITI